MSGINASKRRAREKKRLDLTGGNAGHPDLGPAAAVVHQADRATRIARPGMASRAGGLTRASALYASLPHSQRQE